MKQPTEEALLAVICTAGGIVSSYLIVIVGFSTPLTLFSLSLGTIGFGRLLFDMTSIKRGVFAGFVLFSVWFISHTVIIS